MSDLSLLWTILSIIGSVVGSVALAAWWLKGQLTGAELAEAQVKHLAEQLAEAKSTNATLQKQIAEGAKMEVLADTAASSSRAVVNADKLLNDLNALWVLQVPHHGQGRPWETFRLPPTEPTNKNIGLIAPSGDVPPSKGLLG